MPEELWSERDVKPDAIEAALRGMLRRRHATEHDVVPARVLNLVVVADRAWKGEVANRLDRVGRYHASRTILCAVEDRRTTLDATAAMGYDERRGGTITATREQVEIDMGPEHVSRLDTIVDPVIVSGLPTVLWCPHGHVEAIQAMHRITDVMLLDSDDLPEAPDGLNRAAEQLEAAYVVDLAWLRTTPWRERLAASFDPEERLPALERLDSIAIRHHETSTASALLLAGWLASRLHWDAHPLQAMDGSGLRGAASRRDGEVQVSLHSFEQEAPGLAGVTVTSAGTYWLSLDRGRGGLSARESVDGVERTWQVLGASRGEGGILGEGVRQALLRDGTYGPALRAARRFLG